MTQEEATRRTRRDLLVTGIGAAGGLIAGGLARPISAVAANGSPILAGGDNTATAVTRITNSAGTGGISVLSKGTGIGVLGRSSTTVGVAGAVGANGTSPYPTGVFGEGAGVNLGVFGKAVSGDAVRGSSATATGVHGMSTGAGTTGRNTGVVGTSGPETNAAPNTNNTGVYGFADTNLDSVGVWGDSPTGYGIYGTGDWGIFASGASIGLYATGGSAGVWADVNVAATAIYAFVGTADAPAPPTGVALHAAAGSTSQVALSVSGRAMFSRSGRVSVAAAAAQVAVTMAGVTTSSYVIATLQTNRSGVYVAAVVPAAGKFTIYLNKAVTAATVVGYLVIN